MDHTTRLGSLLSYSENVFLHLIPSIYFLKEVDDVHTQTLALLFLVSARCMSHVFKVYVKLIKITSIKLPFKERIWLLIMSSCKFLWIKASPKLINVKKSPVFTKKRSRAQKAVLLKLISIVFMPLIKPQGWHGGYVRYMLITIRTFLKTFYVIAKVQKLLKVLAQCEHAHNHRWLRKVKWSCIKYSYFM